MKKDLGWHLFFADAGRFADLINGLGCEGNQVVTENDVRELDAKVVFKRSFGRKTSYLNGFQDSLRRVVFGMNFMIVSAEWQENMDYEYPLRDLKYEAAEYDRQLRKTAKSVRKNRVGLSSGEYLYGFRKTDKLKPVVTFVLYSGEEPWDGPTSLWDMLDFTDIPESMSKLVPNHKINVIDIRRLENTDVFRSDVREVFDYIKYSKNKEKLSKLVEGNEYFKHMDEDAFDLVTSYLDSENVEVKKERYTVEGGGVDMCTAIREMIEDGRAEGREEGRQEGMIMTYISLGFTPEEISERENLDIDKVKSIVEKNEF